MRIKKQFWKRLLVPVSIVILITAVLALTSAINKSFNHMTCKSVDIEVDQSQGNLFIGQQDIKRLLEEQKVSIIGKPLKAFDLGAIERLIEDHPFVRNAEIYVNGLGEVKIEVSQRVPILRVINSNGVSYYLDENGSKMPFSHKFTARVPVATGNIDVGNQKEKTRADLFFIAKYLKENPFWEALVEQIYITRKFEIEIIPSTGNHIVVLGTVDDLEQKFENLLLFYKKGLNKTGWYRYRNINLKYKNQIVCTKY